MSSSILTSDGYSPEEDQISKRLDAIAMNIDSVMSADVLKKCMSFMDLTSLHNEDTPASIEKLVGKVNAFKGKYPEYPLPASICVYPNFAGLVRENLRCEDVHVTTVSGCFPTSQSFLDVKVKECEMAVAAGADEIDIVLALHEFLNGNYDAARKEIRSMCAAVRAAVVCEKSDEVVVALKYGKPYGAKDRTYQAFPDLKHIYHNEDKKVWQVRFRIYESCLSIIRNWKRSFT